MDRKDGFTKVTWLLFALVASAIATSSTASAHGPTVEISHDKMTPPLLNLFVGTTVHFMNVVDATVDEADDGQAGRPQGVDRGHVVVDVGGTLKSPVLAEKGEGWHYTFEEEGGFDLFIRNHPDAKSRIVIVPKR